MTSKQNDETPKNNFNKENDRWKDYASTLLIAIAILLGGVTLSKAETSFMKVSSLAGIAGIFFIVLWYGRDNPKMETKERSYPKLLFWASMSLLHKPLSESN